MPSNYFSKHGDYFVGWGIDVISFNVLMLNNNAMEGLFPVIPIKSSTLTDTVSFLNELALICE